MFSVVGKMVNYQYTYLIGDLILLIIWLALFLRRKDTRKEMLIIGICFGLATILTYAAYAEDWWRPLTLTGESNFSVEDFLFGFFIGGISAVIYEHLFNKRIKIKNVKKLKDKKRNISLLIILFLMAAIFLVSFFILGNNSLKSTIAAFVIPTLIIYKKRPDLIKNSLVSGVLILALSIVGYNILNLITPGFFDQFWLFENIGRKIFLGIPLEEYVFYLLLGMFVGPLYEYWKEGKLINIKK